jgi:glycosyltransferase involved in cell wall biosynthesis
MRIAMVSTCAVTVPPKAYGGTELVTAELSKMLTRLGHDVTVFATGDSAPEGKLLFHFPTAIWPPDAHAELRHAAFAWRHIMSDPNPFDIVHAHQAPSLAMAALQGVPVVATLHHERDPSLLAFYRDSPGVTYVAISKRQAELSPELGIRHVIHHGLDPDLYPEGDGRGGYCAFLGRLCPEKAPHLAIDAARLARMPLKIGGVAHEVSQHYFNDVVKPRIDRSGGLIQHLGELSHAPKVELLRHARALLFPIRWEEPFGLVMIEAMLVGTPVIAFPRGAAGEVIEAGVTGFLVRSVEEMAECIRTIGSFDRGRCRARARARWSSMRMARDYEEVYRSIVASREPPLRDTISGIHVIHPEGADAQTRPLDARKTGGGASFP